MRDGTNPNRLAKVDGYAPIVVSAITHLPHMKGYHENRLDVVMCSLETLRKNAGTDCEVLVWDNGSCPTLTDWLKDVYRPDYLVLAPNMGKSIARASIVNMLPSGTIVGVADDDMYYYPNWLREQVRVLKTYPNVGTVSGWPVRTQFRFHNQATVRWAQSTRACEMQVGRFISAEEDKDFCTSIGRDYTYQVPYTAKDKDILLTYRGVKAYATGHHAQWIGYVDRLKSELAYTKEAMADERPFENEVDCANMLRLTTYKRYTQHIGNKLDPKLEALWRNHQ